MRLYWNDVVISRHASAEQIEASIARFREEPEAALELRRNSRARLRAERAVIDGETSYLLEYRRAEAIEGIVFPSDGLETVVGALRGYVNGTVPEEFLVPDSYDPDCPLCAMLARQQAQARGSC